MGGERSGSALSSSVIEKKKFVVLALLQGGVKLLIISPTRQQAIRAYPHIPTSHR